MNERIITYYNKVDKKADVSENKTETDSGSTVNRDNAYKYDLDRITRGQRERTSRVTE